MCIDDRGMLSPHERFISRRPNQMHVRPAQQFLDGLARIEARPINRPDVVCPLLLDNRLIGI
jgi:hypothetical protein